MTTYHVVIEGECVSSIAYHYGFFRQTLEKHPENAALVEKRGDLNVLAPGDVVFVPDLTPKTMSYLAGATYRFRRLGVPEVICIRLRDRDEQPRAGLAYSLTIDGHSVGGTTNAQGKLQHFIPPDAKRCELRIDVDGRSECYVLDLGKLAPIDSLRGVQQRLKNLGLLDEVNEALDDPTRAALQRFQSDHELTVTGEIDDDTCTKLKHVYQE